MHQLLVVGFNQLTIGRLLNVVCLVENAGMDYGILVRCYLCFDVSCFHSYLLIFLILATFMSFAVQEKLFSSRNRTEVSLAKKLKIEYLPEIEKIHKVCSSNTQPDIFVLAGIVCFELANELFLIYAEEREVAQKATKRSSPS